VLINVRRLASDQGSALEVITLDQGIVARALHATGLNRLLDVAVAAPGGDTRHGQRDVPKSGEKHRGELGL
jgi:hypothetical protein